MGYRRAARDQGVPWEWTPDAGGTSREASDRSSRPQAYSHESQIHRSALRLDEFLAHRCSDQCPGCQAILRGTSRQAHSEACHEGMHAAIALAPAGQRRIQIKVEKESVRLASQVAQQVSQASASGSSGLRLGHRSRPERRAEFSAKRIRAALDMATPANARLDTDSHRVIGNPARRRERRRGGAERSRQLRRCWCERWATHRAVQRGRGWLR